MRRIYAILMIFAALFACVACEVGGDDLNNVEIGGGEGFVPTSTISPSCVVESRGVSRAESAGIVVRSLVDQVTTKRMEANFLRLDEDLDGANNGLYTFTGNTATATNWNKALLLESTIISSPDNTDGIHYRSVSLMPEQSYKLNIKEENIDGVIHADTTHFYHTRMVGWYPMNCRLPRKEGVPATAQFDYSDFDAVRLNETVEINGVPTDVVALQFKGLDGETDLMVSNVCEAQSWHRYNSAAPHQSDVHPQDGSNIYREPFGHNITSPHYSNYFTYRHYRSAIRVVAHVDRSAQNLNMWGDITNVMIRNQPTSCKVWLPTELGKFGEVYHWDDYKDMPIISTPMFGDDNSNPEYNESAKYPIDMSGFYTKENIYLGYSLVQPNRDVELEVHTTAGIYSITLESKHKVKDKNGNETVVDIFDAGYIYHIMLNFKTDGTVAAILEKEGDERYYDLSSLQEFEVDEHSDKQVIKTFKLANCYIVDPNQHKDGEGNDVYDGYCFLATMVGNGESGIISSGAQTLYPTEAEIAPVSAHLLWESQLGLITDVELKFGYVRFKLPDTTARGNAVIAVYDKNERVLWSWHIWITDQPSEQRFSVGEHEIVFLDRNIGATAATCNSASTALATYGLYYQWGRKDPSMGPPTYNYSPINLNTAPYYDSHSDEKTAAEVVQFAQPTLKDGLENPMYLILPTGQPLSYIFNWTYERYDFLWGYNRATGMTSKTIYDPCPFGYRVPSSELSALFSEGSGSAGTYGYTRTVGGQQFFFPYAGFKGVDVGLNSLVCAWKYVGSKGDYQSSMYCTDANATKGEISQFMHRARVYISKDSEWTEVNVGTYNGNMHIDFSNRRTAAPVRCVKDEKIGSISATLTPSERMLVPDTQLILSYKATSYGSSIESAVIKATYTNTAGVQQSKVLREVKNIHEYELEGSVTYKTPTDSNEAGVIFHLVVRNEHGLLYTEELTLVEDSFQVNYNRWEDTMNTAVNSSNRDFVVVGEEIRYYVNISASVDPSSVTVDGIPATRSGGFNGTAVSNTVWYVTWSKNSKGVYPMTVSATIGNSQFSKTLGSEGNVTVYGLTLNGTTTAPDTTGATLYAIQNTSYTSTYLTSLNTTLGANTSLNYYNLFTIDTNSRGNIQIKSEARGTYFRGTNGSVSFNSSATGYSYRASGSSIYITYSNYYLRQSNSTTVQISSGNNNNSGVRTWNVYRVTYDMP